MSAAKPRDAERPILYRAAAIRDDRGRSARPGAVLVRRGRIVAAGHPDELPRKLVQEAQVVERPGELLLPALVNAHTHTDLTELGHRSYGGDFLEWLRAVIRDRPTTPDAIARAVHKGLILSRAAGTGHLGDIAGSLAAIHARQEPPPNATVPGVSYLECVGRGEEAEAQFERAVAELNDLPFEVPQPGHDRGVVLGLSPHAPYSTSGEIYERSTKLSHRKIYRLTTHLAESRAELDFVRDATGPFAELLRELGKWDDSIEATGQHPVDWLQPELKDGRWLLAHCNYVEDEHIEIFRRTGTSVVYCPVASDYFGHTGHRYREMLEAGVNVCMGTDSILCQPEECPGKQPLSVLNQMRHVYRRDRTEPELLLRMATTNGMLALEFRETDASLAEGAPAVFAAVAIDPEDETDPLVQALMNDSPVRRVDETT